jgi:hypothetical protein
MKTIVFATYNGLSQFLSRYQIRGAVVSEMSINTLPRGIYLVRLYSSSGTSQTQKLVKN